MDFIPGHRGLRAPAVMEKNFAKYGPMLTDTQLIMFKLNDVHQQLVIVKVINSHDAEYRPKLNFYILPFLLLVTLKIYSLILLSTETTGGRCMQTKYVGWKTYSYQSFISDEICVREESTNCQQLNSSLHNQQSSCTGMIN